MGKVFWMEDESCVKIENSMGAKLYWVETIDHDEDWFIIAHNYKTAMKFHNDYEGYDYDIDSEDIIATPTLIIPPDLYIKFAEEHNQYMEDDKNIFDEDYAFHGHIEILRELGGKIISERNQPMKVIFNGVEYVEGDLQTKIDHVLNMHKNKHQN